MAKPAKSNGEVQISYDAIRNLTSPEEAARNARTYFANVPVEEILKIGTRDNLRDYIPDHPGKLRNGVHRQIAETIINRPDLFISLHSGFAVTSKSIDIDDKRKTAKLVDASVINGAQSQGELRRYFQDNNHEEDRPDFHVRMEIYVEEDPDLITDVAIARNTSTKVEALTIAGKMGVFEDMEKSLQKKYPNLNIRKSETNTEPGFVDPLKLLQICTVLRPAEVLDEEGSANTKLRAYMNKAKCLDEIVKAWGAKDRPDSEGKRAKALYDFCVDIVPFAYDEYNNWRHHPAWKSKYLKAETKAIKREGSKVTVANGIIFPILGALSPFVTLSEGKWVLSKPSVFDEEELITQGREYLKFKNGNPVQMGRDIQAYDRLFQFTKSMLRIIGAIERGSK